MMILDAVWQAPQRLNTISRAAALAWVIEGADACFCSVNSSFVSTPPSGTDASSRSSAAMPVIGPVDQSDGPCQHPRIGLGGAPHRARMFTFSGLQVRRPADTTPIEIIQRNDSPAVSVGSPMRRNRPGLAAPGVPKCGGDT